MRSGSIVIVSHLSTSVVVSCEHSLVAVLCIGAKDRRICPLFGKLVRPFQVVLAWLRDLNNPFVFRQCFRLRHVFLCFVSTSKNDDQGATLSRASGKKSHSDQGQRPRLGLLGPSRACSTCYNQVQAFFEAPPVHQIFTEGSRLLAGDQNFIPRRRQVPPAECICLRLLEFAS